MLDTVKINHVQHISFTQSRLTDAVSVILSELLSYEHPAKRPVSIISRLDTNLRREVESMLCDGRYTYSDVAQYLASQGVPISIASVCRYAKMLYVNYNDEEGRLEA